MLKLFGWNTFVANQPENLRPAAAQFQNLFNTVGLNAAALTLIIVTAIVVVIYYFIWTNHSTPRAKYRYRAWWWLLFLFVSGFATALLTQLSMLLVIGKSIFNTNAFSAVSLCNFLYSLAIFILLSILITASMARFTNASCTPLYVFKKIR